MNHQTSTPPTPSDAPHRGASKYCIAGAESDSPIAKKRSSKPASDLVSLWGI